MCEFVGSSLAASILEPWAFGKAPEFGRFVGDGEGESSSWKSILEVEVRPSKRSGSGEVAGSAIGELAMAGMSLFDDARFLARISCFRVSICTRPKLYDVFWMIVSGMVSIGKAQCNKKTGVVAMAKSSVVLRGVRKVEGRRDTRSEFVSVDSAKRYSRSFVI